MSRTSNEKLARSIAFSEGLSYGMSALDGFWYVGTWQQLNNIGCADIREPKTESEAS